ncbi:MAG TPA: hypothetical protein PLC40_14290, partial [Candidatus Hydrogenedentes bacterium]|nr:hypothetical protein [Candidatus Hydrogenedentota bacterium]
GLDGTRVFAHYMTSHYDSAQMIEQDKVIRNVCEHMKATTIPACMLLDGDDLTPPWPGSPQGIENLRALAAFPKIEFSTPHRFFSSFDTAADGLRVVQGEFISTTDHRHNNVGAYSTFAEVKLRNRRSEWGLRTLEAMATLAMRDGGIYPTKHAARAWRLTLFNQMHDIFPGTAIFEAYEEAYKRYDEVDSICSIGTNAVANVLASTINTKGDGIPVVLFNTLGWDRNDPAEILLTEPHSYCDGFEVRDGNGRPVPAQTLSTDIGTFDKTNKNFRLLVQPDGIPAIGYKTVWLHPAHHDERVFSSMVGADRLTLDNDFVRVTINPRTGWVSKLFDKRLNRNVLPDGKEACAIEGQGDVIQNLRYSFDADNDASPDTPRDFDVSLSAHAPENTLLAAELGDKRTLRGIPAGAFMAFKEVQHYSMTFPWATYQLTWDENDLNIDGEDFEGLSFKDPQERWEGIITQKNDYFKQIGGPSCGPVNKRYEVDLESNTPIHVYYCETDQRIHLFGANHAWLLVDYDYDREPDMRYDYYDTDEDGYVDTWRLDLDMDGDPDDEWQAGPETNRDVPYTYTALN